MVTHEQSTDLLDTTMQTLEGDLTTATPQSGKGIIDQWINALREGENTNEIANTLDQLKTQLDSGQPNAGELQQLLLTLAEQTRLIGTELGAEGDLAPRLEALSAALRNAGGQLASA